jgi:excisionase family DNA binding protein
MPSIRVFKKAPRVHAHVRPLSTAKLLSLQQAADELGLSIATLRSWVWMRRIESVRLGRSVRIRRSVIEKLIEQNVMPADRRVAIVT